MADQDQTAGSNSNQFQSQGDMTINHIPTTTRLSKLFETLKKEYQNNSTIAEIYDDLNSYKTDTDVIGLEEKLKNGGRSHLFETMSWAKQEYRKKLERFEYFPAAQKIHALILASILEKFTAYVSPLIRANANDQEILKTISEEVVSPILKLIESEGCEDVMGLSATDIVSI